jgi:hypothetical protein
LDISDRDFKYHLFTCNFFERKNAKTVWKHSEK